MFGLFISTILTSAADSLNPIAITQQFVLQGMVKKARHIWYFIISIALTNMASGFLAYFGLITFIGDFFGQLFQQHGQLIVTLELIVGIGLLIGVSYLILNKRMEQLKTQIQQMHSGEKNEDEKEAARKIKSVSPAALVVLGVGATISELTTALPYFAFLAILFNYQLTLLEVTLLLLVYNFIYSLPLIILYFVYVKAQDKFDHLYTVIKVQLTKWSNVIAPAATGLAGIALVYHSVLVMMSNRL